MKIYFIDDDPAYQLGMKIKFRKVSVPNEVIFFSNGQEGISDLNRRLLNGEELPDIIFLDLNMPVMNGWEFLEAYNELDLPENHTIHLYVVSSSIDPRDSEKALSFERVKDYKEKPLEIEEMEEILARIA